MFIACLALLVYKPCNATLTEAWWCARGFHSICWMEEWMSSLCTHWMTVDPMVLWQYEKCTVFTPHRESPYGSFPPYLCSWRQSQASCSHYLPITYSLFSPTFSFSHSLSFFSSFNSCPISIGKYFPPLKKSLSLISIKGNTSNNILMKRKSVLKSK